MSTDPSELLAPEAVEKIYKWKRKTLANWRSLKFGPDFIKIGNRIFYRRADLEEFLEYHRTFCDITKK
jgi:hypothetical protein